MKYPIFEFDGSSIDNLYYSIGDVEISLEPWALEDKKIKIYDSEGSKVNFIIQNKGDLRNERVVFDKIETNSSTVSTFKNSISFYLKYYHNVDQDWIEKLHLSDLVKLAIDKVSNRRKK